MTNTGKYFTPYEIVTFEELKIGDLVHVVNPKHVSYNNNNRFNETQCAKVVSKFSFKKVEKKSDLEFKTVELSITHSSFYDGVADCSTSAPNLRLYKLK